MTKQGSVATLRFEDAGVSLGDELRGARATTGKSIEEIERDLKIKAKYIYAIEKIDMSAMPGRVYADGFLRSYARYLKLDEKSVVERFYAEAGIPQPPVEPLAGTAAAPEITAPMGVSDNPLKDFAALQGGDAVGFDPRGALRLVWPVALVAGLGAAAFFGYNAARDANLIPQRAGPTSAEQAPATTSPSSATETLEIERVGFNPAATLNRPKTLAYAAPSKAIWTDTPPTIENPATRLSDVDPELAGAYAADTAAAESSLDGTGSARWGSPFGATSPAIGDPRAIAQETRALLTEVTGFQSGAITEALREEIATVDAAPVVALRARAEVWLRLRDADGTPTDMTLAEGQRVPLDDPSNLTLHIGNAGGLFIDIGNESYGPLGRDGAVMRDISLAPAAVRERFPPQQTASNLINR